MITDSVNFCQLKVAVFLIRQEIQTESKYHITRFKHHAQSFRDKLQHAVLIQQIHVQHFDLL